MVCWEMGFLGGAKEAKKGSHSGPSPSITDLKFVMDNVYCLGDEEHISYCNYSTSHNCERGEEAGVTCIGEN